VKPARVQCYSGGGYADRPVRFTLGGTGQDVREIEGEWLEPGEKHFLVRTEDDRRFELCYNYQNCQWSARNLGEKERG